MLILMFQLQGKKKKKNGFHNFCAMRGSKLVSKIPKFVFGWGGFAPLGLFSKALPLHPTRAQVAPGPRPFEFRTPQALFLSPMPDTRRTILIGVQDKTFHSSSFYKTSTLSTQRPRYHEDGASAVPECWLTLQLIQNCVSLLPIHYTFIHETVIKFLKGGVAFS